MNQFWYGLKKGVPIGIGYLAVSFAFGVEAVQGLTPLMATILSLTNLTSAGQFAGIQMIFEHASYLEIAVSVLLINLRYSLMSISLSQRLDPSIPTWKRLIFGFGITDEVYAVSVTEKQEVTAPYMFGLILVPIIGWTAGTAIGAFGSSLFGEKLLNAFGIALYAMFIAIIIPDAKKKPSVLFVIVLSTALSCCFYYIPFMNQIGTGIKIILVTVIGAVIGALIFPLKDEETEEKQSCIK